MQNITGENIAQYLANTPQITFEVTQSCNLACMYCAYGSLYTNRKTRNNINLNLKNAISFLHFIKTLWDKGYDTNGETTLTISFYGGEPLLNFSCIETIVDYIENNLLGYNKIFNYSMTTNALLLPRYMDYLVKHKFKLLISLDGDEQGNTCRVFPNHLPAFNQISEAIQQIQNKFPDYFAKNVNFNSVLTKHSSVEKIIRYIKNKYNQIPTISEISSDEFRRIKKICSTAYFVIRLNQQSKWNIKPTNSLYLFGITQDSII